WPDIESDAIGGWRVGELPAAMGGIVELARRHVPGPPKPSLDRFPHDRGILGRADAAERRRGGQAAAERRRADRYGEQSILVVDRPSRRANEIDVDAVRAAAGPHADAGNAERASTALPDLGGHPPAELGAR